MTPAFRPFDQGATDGPRGELHFGVNGRGAEGATEGQSTLNG